MLQDLISFLQNPSILAADSSKMNFRARLVYCLNLTCLLLGIVTIFSFLATYLSKLSGFSAGENYTVVSELSRMSFFGAAFILTIFGPFREEWAFRLFFSRNKSLILLGLFGFAFFALDFFSSIFDPQNTQLTGYLALLGLIIVFIITLNFVLSKEKLENFVSKNLKFIIYLSAILFSLIHVSNYNNILKFWWLAPFLVIPQFIVGLFLPMVRVKFGFWWSVFVHGFYNLILGFSILLLLAGPAKVRDFISSDITSENISKLSDFEQAYIGLVSFLQLLLYATVFFIFVYQVSIYFKKFLLKVEPKDV